MRTYLFIRGTVLAASLTLITGVPVLLTQAADQPCGAGIPEVMAGQPAPQHDVLTPEVQPAQAIWVDEIRNSLDSDRKNYPTPNFDPYFKKLNVVDEAVGCGDRRVVKVGDELIFQDAGQSRVWHQ